MRRSTQAAPKTHLANQLSALLLLFCVIIKTDPTQSNQDDPFSLPFVSFAIMVWCVCLLTLKVFISAVMAVAYDVEYLSAPQGPQQAIVGSSLSLSCSYTLRGTGQLRVKWWFGQTAEPRCMNSDETLLSEYLVMNNATKLKNNGTNEEKFTLELKNVTQNYSGWYFCQVTMEIPKLKSICSNGTHLNIATEIVLYVPPAVPREGASWLLWVMLGAGMVVLAVSVGSIWMLYHRIRGSRRENPIYENMHRARKSQATPERRPTATLQTPTPLKPAVTLQESSDIRLPKLYF